MTVRLGVVDNDLPQSTWKCIPTPSITRKRHRCGSPCRASVERQAERDATGARSPSEACMKTQPSRYRHGRPHESQPYWRCRLARSTQGQRDVGATTHSRTMGSRCGGHRSNNVGDMNADPRERTDESGIAESKDPPVRTDERISLVISRGHEPNNGACRAHPD